MEGIPVKISEKYKPPRRISLPAGIQNKLNTAIQFEKYDFGLENYVLEQTAKLKEQLKLLDAKQVDIANLDEQSVTISSNRQAIESILTPVPLQPHISSIPDSRQVVGGINISDFENDTSSPFDSVELKTINDMEVLAHVLGGTSLNTGETWTSNENGCNTQNWAWGYSAPSYPIHPAVESSLAIENESTGKANSENQDNNVSVIMKNLQRHIEERNISQEVKKTASSGLSLAAGVTDKEYEIKKETLPNPFSNLNGACQTIAGRIAEMGFPISRAARATKMFGPNEGKVIEFMLEVQSLEECGYPGESAERALVACEFSRENALKFLDNTTQIKRLGFSEDEVIAALIKAEFDRDKALDSLIS